MADAEHRHDPRVKRALIVRYREAEKPGAFWLASPLRDMSRSGARFLSERAFASGTVLELQLVMPVVPRPVALTARVAWVRPSPLGGGKLTELGVTFEPVEAEAQQALETVVAHFLKKSEQD